METRPSTPEIELVEVAAEYRHLRGEHKREREEGATRRHQHARMTELEQRFETLLGRWVPGSAERDAWRDHLYRGGDAPEAEGAPGDLLFRGRAGEGGTVEVYEGADGTQRILVDGREARRRARKLAFDEKPRPLAYLGREFEEITGAPEAAVAALKEFVARPSGEPPWQWARDLLDDGLIDRHFSLTTRGRRLFARR